MGQMVWVSGSRDDDRGTNWNTSDTFIIEEVYAKGGRLELENFDLTNLDPLEEMHYERMTKSGRTKEESLNIIINTVEGDYTQLTPELAKIAEKQTPQSEWDAHMRERDGYAKGGKISKAWDKMYKHHTPKNEDEDTQVDFDLRELMDVYLKDNNKNKEKAWQDFYEDHDKEEGSEEDFEIIEEMDGYLTKSPEEDSTSLGTKYDKDGNETESTFYLPTPYADSAKELQKIKKKYDKDGNITEDTAFRRWADDDDKFFYI